MQLSITSKKEISSILKYVTEQVRRRTEHADDADDIAQEAVIKILTTSYAPRRMTKRWMYTVVRNCVYDTRRRQKREQRMFDPKFFLNFNGIVCEALDGKQIYTPSAPDQAKDIQIDIQPAIERVVRGLSEPLKGALWMSVEGYSYEEIARVSKTNLGTAKSRVHYARKRAKELLKDVA